MLSVWVLSSGAVIDIPRRLPLPQRCEIVPRMRDWKADAERSLSDRAAVVAGHGIRFRNKPAPDSYETLGRGGVARWRRSGRPEEPRISVVFPTLDELKNLRSSSSTRPAASRNAPRGRGRPV